MSEKIRVVEVEKLKKKIAVGFADDEVVGETHFINEHTLFDWIDSLAVEREPVQTDAIMKALEMCEDEIRDYNDRALPHNINEALDAAYSQIKQLEALKARNG